VVSRADLPSKVEEKIEEIMSEMEARERLSRADIGRQLRRLVASSLEEKETSAAWVGG